MKIDFGFKKVAIYTGFTKEGLATCRLEKLLLPKDLDRLCDVPCIMQFHNKEGLQALIDALEELKGEMNEE